MRSCVELKACNAYCGISVFFNARNQGEAAALSTGLPDGSAICLSLALRSERSGICLR